MKSSNIDNIAATGVYKMYFHNAKTGALERTVEKFNLVTDIGLQAILDSITDLNYIAIGDDPTAVSLADTTLGNETFRKLVLSSNGVGNVKSWTTFLTHAEGNGTIEEVGIFQNGTGTADSGDLFSRAASPDQDDLPVVKTDLQTLTIVYELTIING